MNSLLWRLIKLLFGLIYRLIMLVLFERWIPFDKDTFKLNPPKQPKQPKQPKSARKQKQQPPPPTPRPARALHPQPVRSYRESEFFQNRSIEPPPELSQLVEGQHLRPRRRPPKPPAKRGQSLAAMARDKQAVRDAMVLGAVFSPPRKDRGIV